MATEVKQTEQQPVVKKTSEERVVEKTQQFWSKNSKFVVYAVAAIVVLVGGWFAYDKYFRQPNELKANESIWRAEQYFRIDSFRLALNGDGANPGFLRVISRYGGTKAGNNAKFYAGVSYLHLGDFNNAVKQLKDFSTTEPLVNVKAHGALGDAYSELGKNTEAIAEYRKAGTSFPDDEINSPEFLYRAAALSEKTGKTKDAIELYKMIKDKYPLSQRGFEVDKYLAKLGVFE
jgi:tetratricopeptide (TPR) repeat protein